MDLANSLLQIGLTEIQVKVYLTLLQLNQGTIQQITNKSKVKRTSVYHSLNNLVNRGLVTFTDKGWHRLYFAENPKKVLLTFREQQEDLKQKERKFLAVMPELASLFSTHPTQPKVSYFDGFEGIKQLYEDTLLTLKKGNELLAYFCDYQAKEWEDYMDGYIKRRVAKGIHARGIAQATPGVRRYTDENKKQLRITKLVSKRLFPMDNEINIYADKVIIISYRPTPFGVLIESKEIANTQRSIFEMAWLGAGKYHK